jgi:hypothetical protein
MANLPAILARDLCADNPFLVVTVEMGLVHGIVILISNFKLAQCNKHAFLKLNVPDVDSFQLAKSLQLFSSVN